MEAKDYVSHATITDLMDYNPVRERLQFISSLRLLHAAMGLDTESGEFMDAIKKHLLYGRPIDFTNLKEEIGDMLWYLALACDELQVSFEEIFDMNIAKLRVRYPNKFTEVDAENRNLDEERKTLEGR